MTINLMCMTRRLLSFCVGLVFLSSSWIKLNDPRDFVLILGSYGLTPRSFVPVISWAIILLEVTVGISLTTGMYRRSVGLPLGTALLVCFALVLSVTLVQGNDIVCGCFGAQERVSLFSVLRAICFCVVLLADPGNPVLRWAKGVRSNLLGFEWSRR